MINFEELKYYNKHTVFDFNYYVLYFNYLTFYNIISLTKKIIVTLLPL